MRRVCVTGALPPLPHAQARYYSAVNSKGEMQAFDQAPVVHTLEFFGRKCTQNIDVVSIRHYVDVAVIAMMLLSFVWLQQKG